MSWRTVIISKRCKLDLKMGCLVIRSEETNRVLLDEISVLLIENNAVSLTGCLLEALVSKKIKVIFCDGKRNPHSELVAIYGSHDCSKKLKSQISWDSELKAALWTEIVAEKIRNQMLFLEMIEKNEEAALLKTYIQGLTINDTTNREGHAAKVYFNAAFGLDFTRNKDCAVNSALNYGYSLILSAFNREIVANGYLTRLGVFHDNTFNFFNLSCDLMEPFRILVDMLVYNADFADFNKEERYEILGLFSSYVEIDGTSQTVLNAIKIYTKSIFDALENKDMSKIRFVRI